MNGYDECTRCKYLSRVQLLVMRKQLHEATDVGLVDEAAASGAQVALALPILVAEIVAAAGRVALEALRRLAKTLGRSPVGFQLGHVIDSYSNSPGRRALTRPLRANDSSPFSDLEALLLFRCKDHDHLLALHQRVLLDDAVGSEVGRDP